MSLRRCTSALAFLLCAAAASPAFANTEAERLFKEGRALLLDGKVEQACPMLEESQRLEPHVGTLLNLAACHEKQGKIGSAWVEYQKALTAARAEGQAERVRLAEARIAELDPRVPWLRISHAGADLVIRLDGGEITRVALETELPVDPGVHLVSAERSGQHVFEDRIELREGEHREVSVLAAPAPKAEPESVLVVEPKTAASPPPTPAKGRWVLEPGIFAAYVGGSARDPHFTESDRSEAVPIDNPSPSQAISCGYQSDCEVAISDPSGATVGLTLFAGYALSEGVHLGLRALAAPSLGGSSPSMWAFGPAVVFRPSERISIGMFGLFGDATLRGQGFASTSVRYTIRGNDRGAAEGRLAGGFGLGVELSIKLFDLGVGAVAANVFPFFIAGETGNIVALPFGLAYRFQ